MRQSVLFILLVVFLSAPVTVFAVEGFPGRTWGELKYELPERAGQENVILDGWVEQGVYWFNWDNLKLNTYAKVRYKWDEKQLDWNNSVGPGAGIALEKLFPKGAYFRGGAEFIWDVLYEAGRTEKKAIIYLNWYGWWDLNKKK